MSSPDTDTSQGHGDARFGQDSGDHESVGADGDESGNVLGNSDYQANQNRRGRVPQSGSHGSLGRGGESSLGGMTGHGGQASRGLYDGQRGEGWGGRPGGMQQDDDPAPGSQAMFGAHDRMTGIGGSMGAGTHGQGGYGGMGQGAQPSRREQSYAGSHAGRGPRGYRRSDTRISEDVHERLTDHPDIDAGEIEVQVQDGEVTLTGTVDDRGAKYLAEDVAAGVSGVREVMNLLKVARTAGAGQGQETRSGGLAGDPSGRPRRV